MNLIDWSELNRRIVTFVSESRARDEPRGHDNIYMQHGDIRNQLLFSSVILRDVMRYTN